MDIVGKAKYGIFFPCKGSRFADEIAGGDYDGDPYWVSTNAELLHHYRPSEPWKCSTFSSNVNKVTDLPPPEALERQLFRLFWRTNFRSSQIQIIFFLDKARSMPCNMTRTCGSPNVKLSCFSNPTSIAVDSWLVYMDRLLTLGDECADEKAALKQKMDELVDIYYDALDADKKGKKVVVPKRLKPEKYPHHMGGGEKYTYKSNSILGEIHDIIDQFNAPITFWKLKCFEIIIPDMLRRFWTDHYSSYRTDMQRAINESGNTAAVYQHYRKVLYGGVDDLESSKKDWEEIRLEALTIYHVCYEHASFVAGDPKKCGFAWKVAGDALLKIYLQDKKEKPLLFAPSVIRQMMS